MKYKNILIISFFSILSLILTVYILGINNLSFVSTEWLAAHDVSTDIISWKFFKNDIWRFPLGSNPNYGMDIGSGIAFSGSVPIMAIIFKLFAGIFPDNFHYFGLWIFICFFLQSYIAYLIIYSQTENLLFAIIGALFFLLSPILINRLSFHLSLCAHWLILMGFYIETKKNFLNKDIYWSALISISALIHFYFTVILSVIFFIFLLNNSKINLYKKKIYKKVTLILISLTLTMFIIGYFDVPFTDALAYGYGNYALDIASIFIHETSVVNGNINWSFFLPSTTVMPPEGFAYLGLGGIFILIFIIIIFITDYKNFIKNKNFFPFLLIILVFLVIAITNKVHLFNNIILNFELPKMFYGLLSIVRASGRLIWPVYYLIFLFSIILIYKKFSKKNAVYILVLIFVFQLMDIYPGLKRHFNSNAFVTEKKLNNYSFWNNLTKKNPTLRTTYLHNQSKFLLELREVLLLKNIKKTDISIHGRYNRKQASISRSNLYNTFNKKQMPMNVIFAIDNFNHLRNLKYLFKDKDVGFFLKNKTWLAIAGYRNQMTEYDKIQLEKYNPIVLKINNKMHLDFKNNNSIHGLGWTHNLGSSKKGLWTEGNTSNLLFRLDENVNDNSLIRIKLNSIITKKNEPINFTININDNLSKKFTLKSINDLKEESIFINLNNNITKENIIHIKFIIDNPVTPLELLESPDARKLGILAESIEISNN